MTFAQFWRSAWEWDPVVIAGCILLVIGYLAAIRGRVTVRLLWFVTGVLVIVFALESPLDVLGDTYLFSAHMVQHLLLLVVAPPLMLFGLPERLVQQALKQPLIGTVERGLGRPLIAWGIGMGTVIAWHLPLLYNAALANNNIHIAEHLLFLVTGVIFWWPVLAPVVNRRLALISTLFYFMAAALANTLLGIVLAYTPVNAYPAYVYPLDPYGLLPLIRQTWGLSAFADRQLGGMLMWMPGGLPYAVGMGVALVRWFGLFDEETVPSQELATKLVAK